MRSEQDAVRARSRSQLLNGSGSCAQGGQITVLFVLLTFVVLCLLGVTLNIGGIFAYHGHLQTATDCSAYSGAIIQARGLNAIAKLNAEIVSALGASRQSAWNGGKPYSSQQVGLAKAEREKARFSAGNLRYTMEQKRINRENYSAAVGEAGRIARKNEPGIAFSAYPSLKNQLTVLERIEGRRQNFRFKYRYYYWVREYAGRNSEGKSVYRSVRKQGTKTDPGPSVTAWVVDKGTLDHTYFCAELLKPVKEFLFTFGGRLPGEHRNLRSYATAMPFGGNLWTGVRAEASYDVKLVRTGDVRPRPSVRDAWAYDW